MNTKMKFDNRFFPNAAKRIEILLEEIISEINRQSLINILAPI